MGLQLGGIQKTALLALAMRAEEMAREFGWDLTLYDSFLSHEAVVVRTIMFRDALRGLIERPHAACVNLGCGLDGACAKNRICPNRVPPYHGGVYP